MPTVTVDHTSAIDESPLPVYLIHWNAPEWCRSAILSIIVPASLINKINKVTI